MITLKGQALSTSHIYKTTCRNRFASVYLSAEGKAIKESFAKQLKQQWKEEPLKGDVRLSIVFFHGDNRKRDIDNFTKGLLDSMNGIIFTDDNQITELYLRKEIDKGNPHVTIEILL